MRWPAIALGTALLVASCGGGGEAAEPSTTRGLPEASRTTGVTAEGQTTTSEPIAGTGATTTQPAGADAGTTSRPPEVREDTPSEPLEGTLTTTTKPEVVDARTAKKELLAAYGGDLERTMAAWGDRESINREELDTLLASVSTQAGKGNAVGSELVDMDTVRRELMAAFDGDTGRIGEAWGDRESITRAELDALVASATGQSASPDGSGGSGGDSATKSDGDSMAGSVGDAATKSNDDEGAGKASEDRGQTTPDVMPSISSGIMAYGNLRLGSAERKNDRSTAPIASRIQVSTPDGSGMVTVTGSPGAVPYGQPDRRWSFVDVIAVEWGTQDCVERRSDGSFSA
ncbi:MAG TPA: hypothetical protein EYP97_08230, partial [Acidimicrobiia bacterium]|nr:hypothetical protein [Acidimicrobiia bacterium]